MAGRFPQLDFAKGVLILLVLFGHVTYFGEWKPGLDLANSLIYSFHMKCFLFISGYLGYSGYFGSKLKDGFNKLFTRIAVPYLIFHSGYYLALGFAGSMGIKTNTSAPELGVVAFLSTTFLHPVGVYWYLQQLLFFFAILHLASVAAKNSHALFLVLLSCLVLLLHVAGVALNPFLLLGALAKLLDIPTRGAYWALVPVLAVLELLALPDSGDNLLLVLLLVGNVLLFLFAFQTYRSESLIGRVAWLGANTMPIYALHPYILIAFKFRPVREPLLAIDPTGLLHAFTATFGTLIACVLLSKLIEKVHLDGLLFGRTKKS